MRTIQNFLRNEEGVDLVEYTLLLAFIALSGAAVYMTMSQTTGAIWTIINGRVNNANQTTQGS